MNIAEIKPLKEFRGKGVTATLEQRVCDLERRPVFRPIKPSIEDRLGALEDVLDDLILEKHRTSAALLEYLETLPLTQRDRRQHEAANALAAALRKSLLGEE